MADLSDVNAAQSIKVIGSDSSGVETTPVRSSAAGEFAVADTMNGGTSAQAVIVVGTSVVELKVGGSALANRKVLTVEPASKIFWGYTNTITTSTGFTLNKDAVISWDASPTRPIYAIASGNVNVKVGESP